jgi:hypothetical protein
MGTARNEAIAKINELSEDPYLQQFVTTPKGEKGGPAAFNRQQPESAFRGGMIGLRDRIVAARNNAITTAGADLGKYPLPSAKPQASAPTSGAAPTIVNRKTGQRMILRNGQWAPVQ